MTPRTVFLGTPEFAVPSLAALEALADAGAIRLVGVVTQPDRPAHRGRITAPPVKARAERLGVPVLQPARLGGEALAAVLALEPELLVWAAYGNRIPRALIDAAGRRALNVHASLLPRWRGAAPIAHAILAGDDETGVTIMEGTAELDRGPIVAQKRTRIGPRESAGELTDRLAVMGADLLRATLPRYVARELVPVPQDDSLATLAPKVATADAAIDWSRPAEEVARRIRAMTPQPGAWTTYKGDRLIVTAATVLGGPPREHGTLLVRAGDAYAAYWGAADAPHVACG
ncbi:MAG TPA: methionyl-tRNA formyltransferase, partial [Candidatus Limnocylindria bacterium]|nr:methionyl-tRNA formyltransferase [Candidatus Limnocylindria bacterium]